MLPLFCGLRVGGHKLCILLCVQFIPLLVESNIFVTPSCNHHLPSCSTSESPDFVNDAIQGSRQLNCCWWLYILFLIITIILPLCFMFLLLCKILSPSSQKETYMHYKNLVLGRNCRKDFSVQYAIKNVHSTFQIWGKSVAQTRKTRPFYMRKCWYSPSEIFYRNMSF